MKRYFFAFFCFCTIFCGFSQEYDMNAIQVQEKYERAYQRIEQERNWPGENTLKEKYVVLFAPGFLSNSFTETFLEYCMKQDISDSVKLALQKFLPEKIKQLRLGDYYHDQISFLQSRGIESYFLKFESEADPQTNALDILRQLMAKTSRKKAILVTHSKGGVDTGVAFCAWMQIQLGMEKESIAAKDQNFLSQAKNIVSPQGILIKFEERVAGWVAQESAFRGSPIADAVVQGNAALSGLAYSLLKFLGGNEKSLQSLVQATRQEWIQKNKEYLHNVVSSIPVISVSAYKKNPDGIYSLSDAILKLKLKEYFDSILSPVRNFMHNQGVESDGLVPWKNAIIDGSEYIVFDNMDHAAPVMDNLVSNIDRIHFLKTLLQILPRPG